ncbi:hypothetical protein KKA53_03105 [Candidatus Dependentiae bacterium]|nr:hypothetical protein [Candidatus Dependentiae bacterium]
MKLDTNKFALAAATTMTLAKVVKMFLWRPFCGRMPMFRGMMRGTMWHYHHGFGVKHFPTTLEETIPTTCPWYYPFGKIIIVFVATFITVWFFAWLYNWLIDKK